LHRVSGAGGRIRTPDLLITNQLLYQLSYTSTAIVLEYNITGCARLSRDNAEGKSNITVFRTAGAEFPTLREVRR
jgi:hypothetical protein